MYPLFLNLRGRSCVVVGGNAMAEAKVRDLLQAGAKVKVIASEVTNAIATWARTQRLQWDNRHYESADLRDAFVVVTAAGNNVNAEVYAEAETRNVLCNAVDDVEHCHFYYGAVVQRGDLQIAISTNGKSPALAQRLRQELEAQFGPEYEVWLEWLGAARELLRASDSDSETNKRLLHQLASRPAFEQFLRETRTREPRKGVA